MNNVTNGEIAKTAVEIAASLRITDKPDAIEKIEYGITELVINHSSKCQMQTLVRNASGVASDEQKRLLDVCEQLFINAKYDENQQKEVKMDRIKCKDCGAESFLDEKVTILCYKCEKKLRDSVESDSSGCSVEGVKSTQGLSVHKKDKDRIAEFLREIEEYPDDCYAWEIKGLAKEMLGKTGRPT